MITATTKPAAIDFAVSRPWRSVNRSLSGTSVAPAGGGPSPRGGSSSLSDFAEGTASRSGCWWLTSGS